MGRKKTKEELKSELLEIKGCLEYEQWVNSYLKRMIENTYGEIWREITFYEINKARKILRKKSLGIKNENK